MQFVWPPSELAQTYNVEELFDWLDVVNILLEITIVVVLDKVVMITYIAASDQETTAFLETEHSVFTRTL